MAFTVTSPFGWRIHPITGEETFHSGVDIGADEGTLISSIFPGEVVYTGPWGGYGNIVVIFHGDGKFTLYGHCSTLLVQKEQKVQRGQAIAQVGSTGFSTGPHVHIEYWVNGEYHDPMEILL